MRTSIEAPSAPLARGRRFVVPRDAGIHHRDTEAQRATEKSSGRKLDSGPYIMNAVPSPMRTIRQLMQPPYQAGWVVRRLVDLRRRLVWLLPGLTARKAFNLLMAGGEFLLGRERMRAWPVI